MTLFSGAIQGDAALVQQDMISGRSGYGCIYADPPWQFALRSPKGMGRSPDGIVNKPYKYEGNNNAERHYKTMPLGEIRAMQVGGLAAPDCALFLWCIDSMLPQAIDVGEAWGFEFKTVAFVWAKLRREGSTRGADLDGWDKQFPMGTGYWTRANPELCLLFTRGAPRRKSMSVRKLVVAPRREHSRKPDEVRASIERLVAGPYLELFARTAKPGWDVWGNETHKFAHLGGENA